MHVSIKNLITAMTLGKCSAARYCDWTHRKRDDKGRDYKAKANMLEKSKKKKETFKHKGRWRVSALTHSTKYSRKLDIMKLKRK